MKRGRGKIQKRRERSISAADIGKRIYALLCAGAPPTLKLALALFFPSLFPSPSRAAAVPPALPERKKVEAEEKMISLTRARHRGYVSSLEESLMSGLEGERTAPAITRASAAGMRSRKRMESSLLQVAVEPFLRR